MPIVSARSAGLKIIGKAPPLTITQKTETAKTATRDNKNSKIML